MQTNLTFELKISLMKGNKWSFIDTSNLVYSTGAKKKHPKILKKIIFKLEYVGFGLMAHVLPVLLPLRLFFID